MEFISCTVFAYGVTSSGKTHTIQGTAEQPGIIPRVVNVCCFHVFILAQHVFIHMTQALLERKREMYRSAVSLSLSYMEIYKDEAYDLLVPKETVLQDLFVSLTNPTNFIFFVQRHINFRFAKILPEKFL